MSSFADPAEPISLCCSCRERLTGELKLSRLALGGDCRVKAGPFTPFSQCQALTVLGKECSFSIMVEGGEEMFCRRNRVFYLEGGEKKELVQALGARDPCERRRMQMESFEDARPISEYLTSDISAQPAAEDKPARSALAAKWAEMVNEFWTCGRDPSNPVACLAELYRGPKVASSISRRMPSGDGLKECTARMCSYLFEKDFAPLHIDYVQGSP